MRKLKSAIESARKVEDANTRIETLEDIVDKGETQEIDGISVDADTADSILVLYNALDPDSDEADDIKERIESMKILRLINIAKRLVK